MSDERPLSEEIRGEVEIAKTWITTGFPYTFGFNYEMIDGWIDEIIALEAEVEELRSRLNAGRAEDNPATWCIARAKLLARYHVGEALR